MRILVVTALAGASLAAATGCGSTGPAPGHGILLAHAAKPADGSFLEGGGDLYVWRLGARPRRLTSSSDPHDEPHWSPNGELVAFTMVPGCDGSFDCMHYAGFELFAARSDGSRQRELTFPARNELRSEQPSWSPDGGSVAFLREFDGYSKLAIVSVASGKTRLLRVSGLQPAWGKRGIAYLEQRAPNRRAPFVIRIVDPRTGRSRPFAPPHVGFSVQSIAWSSRGELAALDGSLAHTYGIAQRVTIYSGAGRRIAGFEVPEPWSACGITWSPRGGRLLLTVYRRAHFGRTSKQPKPQLYTVDPRGKHWHQLAVSPALASCTVSWR